MQHGLPTSSFEVRAATLTDLEEVHALIVELAEYEKAPQEVTLSLPQLRKDAEEGCFEVTVMFSS